MAALFQSTHPRGCDVQDVARGAARMGFNPRTREGATRQGRRPAVGGCFNPRTREGATIATSGLTIHRKVSIHAPARVRPTAWTPTSSTARFQSTHPRGCDQRKPKHKGEEECFNPRTREGATWQCLVAARLFLVSIHAPARVRLGEVMSTDTEINVSIHAPARVRPARGTMPGCRRTVSIHAPARVRRVPRRHRATQGSFNPRTREGATPLIINAEFQRPNTINSANLVFELPGSRSIPTSGSVNIRKIISLN